MKYSIRKTSSTTARLCMESSASLDPTRKPKIMRFYPGMTSPARISTGAVFGREAGKTCALIVHVRPKDLIGVREKLLEVDEYSWRYFQIDEHHHPVPLNLPNRWISQQECSALLSITETEELDQIDFADDGLLSFFAQRHPDWLQAIADRQIRHWKRHKPEKFFRLASAKVAGQEIARCVRVSPFAALSRFKDQLNINQLRLCIRKCPQAAVMFALDNVPKKKRESYLLEHPTEALQVAADRLSDREMALCAMFDTITAFRWRHKMTPKRHAILLANSYIIAFCEIGQSELADLHVEIRASIIGFPQQWRDSDPDGFPSIFSGLSGYLNMRFDPAIMTHLLQNTDPEDQQAIAKFIADKI